MIDFLIAAGGSSTVDAVLVTHRENDHYSVPTCRQLKPIIREFHSKQSVASRDGVGRLFAGRP